jgi:hypothetical protein
MKGLQKPERFVRIHVYLPPLVQKRIREEARRRSELEGRRVTISSLLVEPWLRVPVPGGK